MSGRAGSKENGAVFPKTAPPSKSICSAGWLPRLSCFSSNEIDWRDVLQVQENRASMSD